MEDRESFGNMTVPQLKKYLSERGVPCSGKRRRELESLAEKAAKVYPVLERCDHEASHPRISLIQGYLSGFFLFASCDQHTAASQKNTIVVIGEGFAKYCKLI